MSDAGGPTKDLTFKVDLRTDSVALHYVETDATLHAPGGLVPDACQAGGSAQEPGVVRSAMLKLNDLTTDSNV